VTSDPFPPAPAAQRERYGSRYRAQMRELSLRVPWRTLERERESLVQWRAFALWVQWIAEAERSVPAWLQSAIEGKCEGFLQTRAHPLRAETVAHEVNEWIENHYFEGAKSGGWFPAVLHHAEQCPKLEQIRRYMARCRERVRIGAYPSFDEWLQQARASRFWVGDSEVPVEPAQLGVAVGRYVDWEAFAFWARLVVSAANGIPGILAETLGERCPNFLAALQRKSPARESYAMWFWEELSAWVEDHEFASAKQNSWLHALRNFANRHVRTERIVAYWVECDTAWRKSPPPQYPSFADWIAEADAFVVPAEG
jgi:hypothetical protein